ncbi:MAG: SDR family oxidoreductase [Actinomycetota bacterium]
MTSASRPVVMITGGSRGIGAATAVMAAERGHDVAITFVHASDSADRVVDACAAVGASAVALRADVANEGDIVAAFDETVSAVGVPRVFVNNAGLLDRATRVEELDVDRIRRVFEVNVVGAFVAAREAVRRMSTRFGGSGGSIVNVSSAAAYLGSPNEYVDYAASKGAIDTMTIGLAKEVATDGIRVNAVRPGLIHTDIHELSGIDDRIGKLKGGVPLQRGGTADEVAEAILWLGSDAASYVTGTLLDVSGGR